MTWAPDGDARRVGPFAAPGYVVGDALELARQLPDESIDCIVTSPPYWWLRDYKAEGQWGMEPTIKAFVERLVALFAELRRTLKPTGTLWLNMGDGYARRGTAPMRSDHSQNELTGTRGEQKYSKASATPARPLGGLKPKDLVGAPWRVALALQADGWWLRSDIVWHKPNILPSSVRDRPAPAHEYLFLLTKAPRYYYDDVAVREPVTGNAHARTFTGVRARSNVSFLRSIQDLPTVTRNCRDVWTIPTQKVKHDHFATFPEELARRAILAGSSSCGVCSSCGAPWTRIVKRASTGDLRKSDRGLDLVEGNKLDLGHTWPEPITLGWRASCACGAPTGPAVVLDPFMGSGTVARVCEALGRSWLGFDVDIRNVAIAQRRLRGVQRELKEATP